MRPIPAEAATEVDAREWLATQLASGPMQAREVIRAAEGAGISEKRLRSAREELCAKPTQEGGRGSWVWRLRDQVPTTTEEARAPLPERVSEPAEPALPPADSPQAVAAAATRWVLKRRHLEDLTAPEARVCAWLIRRLANGPRRRLEIEELAADDLVSVFEVRAAAARLVIPSHADEQLPSRETWALNSHLPPASPALIAAHALTLATRYGWSGDPRSAAWLPVDTRRAWLDELAARHRRRVEAVAEATRELLAFIPEAAATLAAHAEELRAEHAADGGAGPAGRALALQVTEAARTAGERRRLEAAVARAKRGLDELQERHARDDATRADLAGRQMRGVSLPAGWQPGDAIFVQTPIGAPSAEQGEELVAARTAVRDAAQALAAHVDLERRRVRIAGMPTRDLT